ncbi:M61 family metallopeptidase [Cyanobacterium sp. IPPAS B-1200]|uniref:M61 family metallopeptidase n=1 Tax=Cyanobacterium sp. IPPAS B-1200 TaxID=1562720 RepID=UPI0008527B39|nr:M61 family metallopeptidase [Cyanobacterium sp. IPPAS B-1200]OEJ79448.1 peptidase M61 [Cyanobacterium sp. IPPAS B-1200]
MNTQQPDIYYQVSMENPELHLFQVNLTITNWTQEMLDIMMPVWTPGSYLVREYSKNLQEFSATDATTHQPIPWHKQSKNHWQIEAKNTKEIKISYKIYANELTVRTNHLDSTHGYFNGAALFFYIPEYQYIPHTVSIVPPHQDWEVTTSLLKISHNTFCADCFDTLVDSPFEIGTQEIDNFVVSDKPHQWVTWGKGNLDKEKLIKDTKAIIEKEEELFGDLPYEDYFFLLHLSGSGFGGLEHKNCCVLNYPRFGFRKEDKYNRFMQLVAHEFFHLWNVKRIRPKELEIFDYSQENYTASLWFCEGVTSYYDILIPYRAKVYSRKTLLDLLSKDISQYLSIPGRHIQPLRESSFDAWIKLYRRDAYSNNNQISYYLKGQFIALFLDLIIRKNSQGQKSFDDVMREMWQRFGVDEIGYTEEELKGVIEEIAGEDLTQFWDLYLNNINELPFNEFLEPFGLILKEKTAKDSHPYLGVLLQKEGVIDKVSFVDANSPAGMVGIEAGDELLAMDGFKVTLETLGDRLRDYQEGDEVEVTIFHQDELKNLMVKLAKPKVTSYQLKVMDRLNENQRTLLANFFGDE